MYCRKCYADLTDAASAGHCPKCKRKFDPTRPSTYLERPFPDTRQIVLNVIVTTLLGIGAGWVISIHQMVQHSGH